MKKYVMGRVLNVWRRGDRYIAEPRHWWENNIKINLEELEYEGVAWRQD